MINKKQGDTLNTQNNADQTPKENSLLITNEQIETTPFRLHGIENEWFVTLGSYRITKNFLTKEEALKHLETEFYNVILQMIGCALDKFEEKEWQKHNKMKNQKRGQPES